MTYLPPRIKRDSGKKDVGKRSPAHRAWVPGPRLQRVGESVISNVMRGKTWKLEAE